MKFVSKDKKAILNYLAVLFAAFIVASCGSKDGDGLYSDTKTVTYAFKLDDASAQYVTALIVYGDRLGVSQTEHYLGSAQWEVSFSADAGFSPFMFISLVKKDEVVPQAFPVKLSYKAGIVNGTAYQPQDGSWTFDDIDEYNDFFVHSPEDDNTDANSGQ